MFAARRRHHSFDIWPGFVDALAAVLMVIIFVLMTFVVAQLYLTDALNDRDQSLLSLNQQIDTLSSQLKMERLSKEEAQKTLSLLEAQIIALTSQLSISAQNLAAEKIAKTQEADKAANLGQQIIELQEALNHLNSALKSDEAKYKEQELELANLHRRLEDTLAKKLAELEALRRELEAVQAENVLLKVQVDDISQKKGVDPTQLTTQKGQLGQFRSDFLSKLVKVLGDRHDIRVVGDRFVFQSEVLFDRGSAELGKDGLEQLDKLAIALKEISAKIPASINWILRVDGHTDTVPIKRTLFPSNWELSSARAISVVRYLISQGIEPKNLVAAGFGEFQPLEVRTGLKADGKENSMDIEKSMARNRRIEFRLDQR
ncbi:MAG: peptidoglycan -binding protein [Alphaproteobacteria bacterium]|nr:peptidoglycan -binding protein [Alphaproteobacteria bacterium]